MKLLKDVLYYIEDSELAKVIVYGGLTVVSIWLIHRYQLGFIVKFEDTARQTLLSAIASATTALLGFVITATTVLMAIDFTKSSSLLAKGKKLTVIHRCFMGTIFMLFLCAIAAFGCLLMEPEHTVHRLHIEILFGLCIATSLRMLTTVYILQDLGQMHINDVEANA